MSQPQPPTDRLDRIERALDRITERHEALTESVELHRAESGQFQRTMAAVIESLHQSSQRLEQNDAKLTAMLTEIREEQKQDRSEFRDAVMRLSVIAEAHQDTLDEHDSRLGNVEGKQP